MNNRKMHYFISCDPSKIVTDQQKGISTKTKTVFRKPEAEASRKRLTRLIAPHAPEEPLKGPLLVVVKYLYPWRKSESKANKSKERILKDTSPDTGNLNKGLLDIMEDLRFYKNDGEIAIEHIEKWWCDEPNGIYVQLEEISNS